MAINADEASIVHKTIAGLPEIVRGAQLGKRGTRVLASDAAAG
jgi:hypothetical protein